MISWCDLLLLLGAFSKDLKMEMWTHVYIFIAVPYKLTFNAWSPVWVGLGVVAFLEEVCH